MFHRINLLLTLLHLQLHQTHASQPSAPSPIPAPLRSLPWGQLNLLHTTDTHGWHGGHLSEPQYSADWGDYISFTSHLRNLSNANGTDLLVVDTGDRIEGNGLYDASHPKGEYTFPIFTNQHIDVITIGNHELYLRNSSENEYYKTVPSYRESYIASNLDIYSPKTGKLEALAPRYHKFTTPNQGIRVLALGFLFNFKGNADNTVVQPVQETIKEQWFQDAVRDKDVDLFLVAGHVPVRDAEEFELVWKAIRGVQWDVPIAFLGGHTHIRDFRVFDDAAVGLESGRYMETVGFMSIDGLKTGGKKEEKEGLEEDGAVATRKSRSPSFKRRYIDNNLYSLHHHSATNASTFDTPLGVNTTRAIADARKKLNLDHTFGCAPHDLWLNRAMYPANDSLLTWLEERVLPDTFIPATERPTLVLTNSGAMRFDIFKGPFTIDSTFLLSPFGSGFRRIKNVPFKAANSVLQVLNHQDQILQTFAAEQEAGSHKLESLTPFPAQRLDASDQAVLRMARARDEAYRDGDHEHFAALMETQQSPIALYGPDMNGERNKPTLPGYTTHDDSGSHGDDTVHSPIRFYEVPNCVAAAVHYDREGKQENLPEAVDLVYNEFVQDWVLLALRYLGESGFGKGNTEAVMEGKSMTTVISDWVGENWGCEE